MFCASLRRRPSFAPILPSLISDTRLTLRESILTTHDLTIPLKRYHNTGIGRETVTRNQRLLLFSSSAVFEDDKIKATVERIQRFASLTGGRDVAIFFLTSSTPLATSVETAMQIADDGPLSAPGLPEGELALHKLQTVMAALDDVRGINILPVARLEQLPDLLDRYIVSLTRGRPTPNVATSTTAFDLLQLCTTNPPMPRQTAYVISDVIPDLPSLAAECISRAPAMHSSSPLERALVGSSSIAGYESGSLGFSETEVEEYSMLDYAQNLIGTEECSLLVGFWKSNRTAD